MQGPSTLEPGCAARSLDKYVIGRCDLEFKKGISKGSCGTVYLGRLRHTDVTIKKVSCRPAGKSESSKPSESTTDLDVTTPDGACHSHEHCLEREAHILSLVRHPNVVMFMGICLQPACLITEWCTLGNLANLIRRAHNEADMSHHLSWPRRLMMAIDIAKGMLVLHTHNKTIVHGDLTTANVLVDVGWRCKVGEFGLSHMEGLPQKYCPSGPANLGNLAPEVIRGDTRSKASDVYAFAMILLELLTLQPAWQGMAQQQIGRTVLDKGERPEIPPISMCQLGAGCNGIGEYVRLIKRCWAQKPEDRPAFETITKTLSLILCGIQESPFPSGPTMQCTEPGRQELIHEGSDFMAPCMVFGQIPQGLRTISLPAPFPPIAGPPTDCYRTISEGHLPNGFSVTRNSEGQLQVSMTDPHPPRLPEDRRRRSADEIEPRQMWQKGASPPPRRAVGEIRPVSLDGLHTRRLSRTGSEGNIQAWNQNSPPPKTAQNAALSPKLAAGGADGKLDRSLQDVMADLRLAQSAEPQAALRHGVNEASDMGPSTVASIGSYTHVLHRHPEDNSRQQAGQSPWLDSWATNIDLLLPPGHWVQHIPEKQPQMAFPIGEMQKPAGCPWGAEE
eukprot:jgi/Botrbrau1/13463/Bobra.0082s0064.2